MKYTVLIQNRYDSFRDFAKGLFDNIDEAESYFNQYVKTLDNYDESLHQYNQYEDSSQIITVLTISEKTS